MTKTTCDISVVKKIIITMIIIIIILHGEVRIAILSNLIIMADFIRITLWCNHIVIQIAIITH